MSKDDDNSRRSRTKATKESKPVITFLNGELRIEGLGWYIEVRPLSSGKQIMVRCSGTVVGGQELIVRPGDANSVFISSRASESQKDEE